MPAEALHVVGYVTGGVLYVMLLVMALRDRAGDRLTVSAATLGLIWNLGALAGYVLRALGWSAAEPWVAAPAFTSLGMLAAVVIHSVALNARDDVGTERAWPRRLTSVAYAGAAAAGALHFAAAWQGEVIPSPRGLVLLTAVLIALTPLLLWTTKGQPNGRRAMWMTALAVFAVSALHVTNFHGPRESWTAELLGHHSSIPLAFAFLYQDYRFALADLFLTHALTLVLMVAVVFGGWSVSAPALTRAPGSPEAVGLLLALWVASTYLFPVVQRLVHVFVDRVVLRRADTQWMLDDVAAAAQNAATEDELLEYACRSLAPALSATEVTWGQASYPGGPAGAVEVDVPTTEPPHYQLRVGRLAGGRRLLSGDAALLERTAAAVGRRIDALRLTRERYDRVLREREMQGLATEAELKALRAQINPHFLFNALTTIGYLIQASPGRAITTLVRLTSLLRGVLRTDGEFTTLGREIELVTCYLDIERERFEERLTVSITIPDGLADVVIPTLVVQPLVENAIKHGIAGARSGGCVTIQADLDDDQRLRVSVRNTGAPLQSRVSTVGGGVGLSNIERRLSTYYGDAATLTLTTTRRGETLAELQIPIAEHGASHAVAALRRGA